MHIDHKNATSKLTAQPPEWPTRTELSTDIFNLSEVFHNRTGRHIALGCSLQLAYNFHADNTAQLGSKLRGTETDESGQTLIGSGRHRVGGQVRLSNRDRGGMETFGQRKRTR